MIVAIYGSYPEPDWYPLSDKTTFGATCYEIGRYFAERRFGIVVTSEKQSTADYYVIRGFEDEWLKRRELPKGDERCLLIMADRTRDAFEQHLTNNPSLFYCMEADKSTRFHRHLAGLSRCDLIVVVGGNDHTYTAVTVAEEIRQIPVLPIGTFGGAGIIVLRKLISTYPDLHPLVFADTQNISAILSLLIPNINHGAQSARALEMKALSTQVVNERSNSAYEIEKLKKNQLRVLVLATEWKSGHGGLSTLNRLFCYALSKAGVEVFCLVLDAEEDDRKIAQDCGVTILKASNIPGTKDNIARLSKKHPELPQDFSPMYIVGHGRVTGGAAQCQKDHYPSAELLHFIHMAPDEIEWYKNAREDDPGKVAEERTTTELSLGMTAAHVITIGPRLHGLYQTDFHAVGIEPLRLDPGFDNASDDNRVPPPGNYWRVLVFGRMDDWELKGLDIAASAIGKLLTRRGRELPGLQLVIRGAPRGTTEEIRNNVQGLAGKSLKVVVREYSSDLMDIEHDIRTASLVLMPSRFEGFGLVGLEAIVAGTPVLLSENSGIAALLKESLKPEQVNRFVVRVDGDDVNEVWSQAIENVLQNREAAFREAGMVRDLLKKEKTWADAINKLFKELGHR
jgi:glycosyltransferase involved in cell wall biosynthesis